jgi:hypothetical protein
MATTWIDREEHELSRESLEMLLDNRIPAIRIRNFATPEECARFAEVAKRNIVKYYSITKRVGYIGLAQYEYRWDRPKSDYFRDAAAAEEEVRRVIQQSFDPRARLIDMLQALRDEPVETAHEEGGTYFAGIIRSTSDGIDLHADWAPLNSPSYDIAQIDGQLGWNFFAESLLTGGYTTVHNRPWSPEAAPGEIPRSYGLDRESVAGAATFQYQASAGDVVLFNTRNPHEVAGGAVAPGGSRVSIGSFIGRMPDRRLVLWS